MNLNFLRRTPPKEKTAMAIPNAEMQAKKAGWDAAFGPTLVDMQTIGQDYGYVAASTAFPWFNRWMLAYGFGSGPFKGVPQKKVSIWQDAADPTRFINNQSVDDHRFDTLTLP